MITLNLEAVKAAARQAYAEGRLSAQAPDPACAYRTVQDGETYACGIGCAISDEQIAELLTPTEDETSAGLNELPLTQLGERWASDNNSEVIAIQRAHDQWAVALNCAADNGEVARFRHRFLALIGVVAP